MLVNPPVDVTIARRLAAALVVACLLPAATAVTAGTLRVSARGPAGAATNAVVMLDSPQAAASLHPASAVIDQRDTQFTPLVSVIGVGSQVRFPNSDNVRHQVYSFSPAKRFQLPLYSGKPAQPVIFDAPGVVELGCNIHDWMIAYVVVADTPYRAITDADGVATITAPAGHYTMHVWHPGMKAGAAPYAQPVDIATTPLSLDVALPLTARQAPQPPTDDRLRMLQDKFRTLKRGD